MDASLLILTAASIGFVHTILGPDHYLPFAAIAKARNWSLQRTLLITAACGLGHILSSVLLGVVGIVLGSQLASLVAIEETRGVLAGWALIAFGLIYMIWGIRRARRDHSHTHRHGDVVHSHPHDPEHSKHATEEHKASLTPWALLIIFVLGPCEALIPLLMYPAAQLNTGLVIAVALCFGVVTLFTMLGAVTLAYLGLRRFSVGHLDRYMHAIAGAAILCCGTAINVLGI